MKISKICTLSAVVIGLSFAAPAQSHAISVDSAVTKIVTFVSKKGSSKMCRKGNFLNKIISLRSFSGLLCGANKSLAGFTVAACYGPNTEGFRDSKCYKKAKSKLGITDGMSEAQITDVATKAMVADLKKAGSHVKKLACTKADSLPGAAGKLAVSKCG